MQKGPWKQAGMYPLSGIDITRHGYTLIEYPEKGFVKRGSYELIHTIMKFSDLPIEIQQQLNCERLNLRNRSINSAYEVLLYNQLGTRYFHARRHQNSWYDDKGNYMSFGGGSEWTLQYGCIGFSRKKQVMGYDYELCRGKTYSKSANGTIIPTSVKTKKEVLSIAKAIGILKTLV